MYIGWQILALVEVGLIEVVRSRNVHIVEAGNLLLLAISTCNSAVTYVAMSSEML